MCLNPLYPPPRTKNLANGGDPLWDGTGSPNGSQSFQTNQLGAGVSIVWRFLIICFDLFGQDVDLFDQNLDFAHQKLNLFGQHVDLFDQNFDFVGQKLDFLGQNFQKGMLRF